MGKYRVALGAALASVLCYAVPAAAHTTSLGYVPGQTPGSVIFYTGSYEHGGTVLNEGTFTLTGVSLTYSSVVNANVAPTGIKPTGLVDGVNNFFWAQTSTGYTFPNSVDPQLFGGVDHWQGISFSGLLPGVYSFTCGTTCGTTQQWESLSTVGGQNGAVQITLSGADIGLPVSGAVPEPAAWAMMILGVGAVGAALRRRRTVETRVRFA